jgi:uncharacterized protein (DUF1778 family)
MNRETNTALPGGAEPLADVGPQPETITLSDRDWAAFIGAIENPPKPNAELKKLFRDHPASD